MADRPSAVGFTRDGLPAQVRRETRTQRIARDSQDYGQGDDAMLPAFSGDDPRPREQSGILFLDGWPGWWQVLLGVAVAAMCWGFMAAMCALAEASWKDFAAAGAQDASAVKARILAGMRERVTTGWMPTCECEGAGLWVRPCVVLDPFAGSGTTLLVAERLGRDSIGIELNPEYVAIAERRIRARDPMAPKELGRGVEQPSLFGGQRA